MLNSPSNDFAYRTTKKAKKATDIDNTLSAGPDYIRGFFMFLLAY